MLEAAYLTWKRRRVHGNDIRTYKVQSNLFNLDFYITHSPYYQTMQNTLANQPYSDKHFINSIPS